MATPGVMMNTATTTTRLMAMVATKTRVGRRVSTSPPRASRPGGQPGSVPVTARTREAAGATSAEAMRLACRPRRRARRLGTGVRGQARRRLQRYGPGGGYGADEYATGAYELPEGSDEQPAERGGRRRKDRGDWTGIFSLRRDRGEDIWPDDGVSDEDYWASVASDQPLTGANPPLESAPLAAADSRPMGRPGGPASSDGGARMPATGGDDVRAGAGPRLGANSRAGGDERFGGTSGSGTSSAVSPAASAPRPACAATISRAARRSRRARQPGRRRRAQGPAPWRRAPATGPQAVRPGAGSAGAWSSQAGYAQPGTAQPSYRPSGPQASYQPGGLAGRSQDSRETDSRQADRGADWGERTERIDRVNASGYPEPRGNNRSQGPGRPGPSRTSGPLGAPVAVGRGSGAGARGDAGRGDGGGRRGWGSADGADRRAPGRDADRDNVRNSGGWPISARGGAPADRAGDDDPLTSRAYSRAAVSDADGRSYRVAARRSQAQTKLTEQATATFTATASHPSEGYRAGQYETGATEAYPAGQYQTGATGEYPAAQRPTGATNGHRAGQHPTGEYGQYQADTAGLGRALPGLRQPAGAVRPVEFTRRPGPVVPADPARPLQGQPAQAGKQARAGQPVSAGQPVRAARTAPAGSVGRTDPAGRTGRARRAGQAVRSQSATRAGSACPPGPPRTPGRTRRRRHRRHSSPGSRSSARTPSHRATAPRRKSRPGGSGSPVGSGSPAGSAPGRTASATTGQNPYESAVTGSYPYPSQPYPSPAAPRRPTPARQRRTPPWTAATAATPATTADTTGPGSRRPMATARPTWTTALPATAPLVTAATDGRH